MTTFSSFLDQAVRVAAVILMTQTVVGYKDLAECIMGRGFPKHRHFMFLHLFSQG